MHANTPKGAPAATPHRPLIGKREKNLLLAGVGRHLDLGLKANCAYRGEYARMLAAMACHGRTAEGESRILRDRGRDAPSGDALLHHLTRLDPASVLAAFLAWNREILSAVGFPATGVLAIDYTTVPYFGKDRAHTVRARAYRGTPYGFELATVYLCHRGMRFTLHAVPVDQFSRKGDVVRELVEEASRYVAPSLVLLDRGFYSGEVAQALLDLGVDFLIPAQRTAAVRRLLQDHRHLSRWVAEHAVGENGPTVTIAGVPARGDPDEHFVFITNRVLDPAAARSLADLYDARWGVETSYRVMKGTGPWTTSNAYAVRLLFHLLMVVLYNLWVLCNRLLQPGAFDERRLLRMEDFLEVLLDALRWRRTAPVAA
jgi:hypothetical protein